SVFPHILSGKPKVYQGVRVKITVKELLQQRRARQAATGPAVSKTLSVSALSLFSRSFFFFFFFCQNCNLWAKEAAQVGAWQVAEDGGEEHLCRGDTCPLWRQILNNLLLSGLPSLLAPFDAEPISSVPNYCPSWQLSNCLSCEESPSYLEQLVDSCLQADASLDPAFGAFQPSSHYTPDTFQPVPLCFSQSLTTVSPDILEAVVFAVTGGVALH
ncbi:POU class 2 homeobox associating factor 3, partial [Falco peregrinus]|uniref:POU class 2 homeobox associating factor 3 n=1 Tax=Falco peregrinus TaxID=8954 RepID=UPI00247B21D8